MKSENIFLIVASIFAGIFLVINYICLSSKGQDCQISNTLFSIYGLISVLMIIFFIAFLTYSKKNRWEAIFYCFMFIVFLFGLYLQEVYIEEIIKNSNYYETFRVLILFATFLIIYSFNKFKVFIRRKIE